MAFPYLTENGFEDGTRGHFDSYTGLTNKITYPSYTTLAQFDGYPAPWRGANCLRVDLSVSNAAAYVDEATSWNTAVGGTIFFRFMLWVGGPRFSMTTGDEFYVWQGMSNTNTTIQSSVGVNYTTANGYRLGLGSTSNATSFLPFSLNKWHSVEVRLVMATNASTLDGWLDGGAFAQVLTSNASAITDGRMGIISQPRLYEGSVLLDDVIADDLRVFPPERRFPHTLLMTTSGHVFVGPGIIKNLALLSGAATDNVLTIYDTDTAYTSDASNIVDELKNTSNSQVVDSIRRPFAVKRGCYVSMSGTNPRCLVQIERAAGYWSDAAVRNVGLYSKPRFPAPA